MFNKKYSYYINEESIYTSLRFKSKFATFHPEILIIILYHRKQFIVQYNAKIWYFKYTKFTTELVMTT